MNTSETDLLAGRYRLQRRIATGGMGEVWLAEDETLGRPVAVKVLHADTSRDPVFAQRFRAEARHLAKLSHPSIVAVHDFGDDAAGPYLVLEYVPGRSVAQLLRDEGPQPPEVVRAMMTQVAGALGLAHETGIVHRDVKPGNLLIAADGTIKLTDFGIARMTEGAGLTRTGEVLGTPQYLSPEQALGQPADGRSDLYALGLVAHELLTGQKAFNRSTPVATALAQVHEEPPPLPDSVPTELTEAIMWCLRKDPADRPESAAAVVAALQRADLGPSTTVLQAPVLEPSVSWPQSAEHPPAPQRSPAEASEQVPDHGRRLGLDAPSLDTRVLPVSATDDSARTSWPAAVMPVGIALLVFAVFVVVIALGR